MTLLWTFLRGVATHVAAHVATVIILFVVALGGSLCLLEHYGIIHYRFGAEQDAPKQTQAKEISLGEINLDADPQVASADAGDRRRIREALAKRSEAAVADARERYRDLKVKFGDPKNAAPDAPAPNPSSQASVPDVPSSSTAPAPTYEELDRFFSGMESRINSRSGAEE